MQHLLSILAATLAVLQHLEEVSSTKDSVILVPMVTGGVRLRAILQMHSPAPYITNKTMLISTTFIKIPVFQYAVSGIRYFEKK